jgi:hypothetical protein
MGRRSNKAGAADAAPAQGEKVESSVIRVRSKRAGDIHGPLSTSEACRRFVFTFGVNDVPRAYLDGLGPRELELLEDFFKAGYLDWEADAPAPAPADPEPPPAPAGPTIADVNAETDRAKLDAWFSDNPAPEVADAIVARLIELDK